MPGIGTRFGTRGLSIGPHRGASTTAAEFPAPTCNAPTKCTQPNTDISTYRDIPNAPSTAHIHEQINTPE